MIQCVNLCNALDTILVNLLKQYVQELQEREHLNRAGVVGPVSRTKNSIGWQEGSTSTMIRDPYVRASLSDMEPLYRNINQATEALNGDARNFNQQDHEVQLEENYGSKLAHRVESQHRYADVHSAEYEMVVDFASKLVGLTKLDMTKVELSVESYLIVKAKSSIPFRKRA
jgi:hypothetical protein